MAADLSRRALAEAVGTAFLVAAVIGSGIAAQRLSPGEVGLQLLCNSLATGAALVAIILALGPVSGAHLNPAVSLADWLLGGLSGRELAAYASAQVGGGAIGCVLANAMFAQPTQWATTSRAAPNLLLAEVAATAGLVLVIFGVARAGRAPMAPFAVGSYITAAYWFTSSTSFANPAVTLGRTLSDTFTGIAPSSAPPFIACQLAGALLAVALVRALYPRVLPSEHLAEEAS
ncbi:MAG: MIP/aquaporin family protein [Egibacteraceae bacterium]